MHRLTLAAASAIVDATLAEGRRHGLAPLAAVVLDAGAHPIVVKREDGASLMRVDIAGAKASGALGMGFNTRELGRRAAAYPVFYTALFTISGGGIAPSAGGVLIRNADGELIGAVGVSGDTSDADEICAVAGVLAAGLAPDPPTPSHDA